MGVTDWFNRLTDMVIGSASVDDVVQARVTIGTIGPGMDGSLSGFIDRLQGNRHRGWNLPTISEALAVPAISRAVTLVSNTMGALPVDAFRDGQLVPTPQVIARPDPRRTPRDFYRDVAWGMATRGECILWIAKRDSLGYPTSLIVVPLHELQVEANESNRLYPTYVWGTTKGIRYTPADRQGDFVHITYNQEPGALRGIGPLQLCAAAVSVSVEAQEFAANFYGDGGHPSVIIKSAVPLGGTLDPEEDVDEVDWKSEADRLRAQWVDRPNNVPRIIDPNIESVEYIQPNTQGAQMLDARNYQNGDAARMFGIPGSLLEYSTPGSSLTYQNLEGEYSKFIRGCLWPNYLEPVEQSLSDLLPRSTVVRFRRASLLQADAKTRWDIYEVMTRVIGPERAAEVAAVAEDLAPGNPEVAPVPFAPPAAVPASLPEVREEPENRCQNLVSRNGLLKPCNKLLFADQHTCPRCKAVQAA